MTVQPRAVILSPHCAQIQSLELMHEGFGSTCERTLKERIIHHLKSMPDQTCDVQSLGHFGNINSILRILKRNTEVFMCQDKTYSLQECNGGGLMQPPDFMQPELFNRQALARS